MTIRKYNDATDRFLVLEIWQAANRAEHPDLPEAHIAKQGRIFAERHLPAMEIYVDEADEIILGFIGLRDTPSGIRIGNPFVWPTHKNRGIRQCLIRYASEIKGAREAKTYAEKPPVVSHIQPAFPEIVQPLHDTENRPLEPVSMGQSFGPTTHFQGVRKKIRICLLVQIASFFISLLILSVLYYRDPAGGGNLMTAVILMIGTYFVAMLYGAWVIHSEKSLPPVLRYGSATIIVLFLYLGQLGPTGSMNELDTFLFVAIVLSIPVCSLVILAISNYLLGRTIKSLRI